MPRGEYGFTNQFVWHDAMQLVQLAYDLSAEFPDEEADGLRGQMRRVAVSVPVTIAEAYARPEPAQQIARFTDARSAVFELVGLMFVARQLRFLSKPNFGRLDERVQQVLGRLNGLIASLSASPSRPASSRIASLVQPTPTP